jgi:NAD-dependent DNA ligase
MNRGIYITANNKVTEQAIALINSIRLYDSNTPIVLIPYDENYHQIAEILGKSHGVKVYQDIQLIEDLSQQLYHIFGQGFFDKPNKLRKHACWFGEFDEFLYIDTDIIVFEKIIDNLLSAIEKSKEKEFDKVLFALGIRYVGAGAAKKIVNHFKSIEKLISASTEEIESIHEIGESISSSIKRFV